MSEEIHLQAGELATALFRLPPKHQTDPTLTQNDCLTKAILERLNPAITPKTN